MSSVVFESASKLFRNRPVLFNWIGRERRDVFFALRDLEFTIDNGEVLVILGPNGSGKTTLLKLISTMLLPDTGRVLVGGADTRTEGLRVRKQVGFAVANERSFFPRLTGRENLDFFASLEDVPRSRRAVQVETALASTELLDSADTLVMKFSSGMYQRLGIARALLKRPRILLLDEATRSLDPVAAAASWKLFRRMADLGTTVIAATHHFDEAVAIADRIAVLRRGSLVYQNSLDRSSSAEQNLRQFYFRLVQEEQEEPRSVPAAGTMA
jgi:ABC-2 type transport system ATP-binding protein